jgi:glutaredoxin 3
VPCRQAKEFLRSQGVVFEDIDVMENVEARQDLVRLTGQMAVPVITVGDEVVRGFDKARLKSLLAGG